MWHTLDDYARQMSGSVRQATRPAHLLRGHIWLSRELSRTGLSHKEFADKYVYRGRTRSNLISLWLSGDASPSRQSVIAIDKCLPGSLAFFELPLFKLLEDAPLSATRIKQLLRPYRSCEWLVPWRFPNDVELIESRTYVGTTALWDCDSLMKRGDFWGFQAIVGLVRLAEATGNQDLHVLCAQDMFRALPAVLREPWFIEHHELLFACLEAIRWRYDYTGLIFDVNYGMLLELAANPDYEPNLHRRIQRAPRDSSRDKDDPIIMGEVIRGLERRKIKA